MSKSAKQKRKTSKSLDLYYDVNENNLEDILNDIQRYQEENPEVQVNPKTTSLLDFDQFNRNNGKCSVGSINVNPTFIIHEAPSIEDRSSNHQNLQFYMLFFLAVIAIFISLGLFYMLYRLLKRLEAKREEAHSQPKVFKFVVESTPHSFMRSPGFMPGTMQNNMSFSNILAIEGSTRASPPHRLPETDKRLSSVESKGSSTSSSPGLKNKQDIQKSPTKTIHSNKIESSQNGRSNRGQIQLPDSGAIQGSNKKISTQTETNPQISNASVKGSIDKSREQANLIKELEQVKLAQDCNEKYNYLMDFTKQNMTSSRFGLNKHLSTTFTTSNKEMKSMKFLLGETDELPLEDGKFKKSFMKSESIGKGSYGEVYKAVHKLDGKVYAVKRIELNENEISDMKKYGVFREVMAMSSINHDNIVR